MQIYTYTGIYLFLRLRMCAVNCHHLHQDGEPGHWDGRDVFATVYHFVPFEFCNVWLYYLFIKEF